MNDDQMIDVQSRVLSARSDFDAALRRYGRLCELKGRAAAALEAADALPKVWSRYNLGHAAGEIVRLRDQAGAALAAALAEPVARTRRRNEK